jgi:hypothetical protein
MKKGDLIRWKHPFTGYRTGLIVKGPYDKRVWGDSGHPEDIEIVTMVKVLRIGSGWPNNAAQQAEYKLSKLRCDASVVSVFSACK